MTLTGSSEHLLRDLAPQVLGSIVRRFRDFADAEDAVQEALIAAAVQWPRGGVPHNPRGWLIQVATRRMTDRLRSDLARRMAAHKHQEQRVVLPGVLIRRRFHSIRDCGRGFPAPALSPSSAIALTLRAVGGLTTAEIAKAFLVPEATMAQRISRAKNSIKASGEAFHLPTEQERAQRLRSVLHVLYLIFNEGYASSVGPELLRIELAREAIRLTRAVHKSLPQDGEAGGLLALMLLTDARRAARTGLRAN